MVSCILSIVKFIITKLSVISKQDLKIFISNKGVRTSNGAEIDLVLERAGQQHLLECKLSKAPKPSRGFYELINAINPESAWVVAPVDEPYEIKKGIFVCPPADLKI